MIVCPLGTSPCAEENCTMSANLLSVSPSSSLPSSCAFSSAPGARDTCLLLIALSAIAYQFGALFKDGSSKVQLDQFLNFIDGVIATLEVLVKPAEL